MKVKIYQTDEAGENLVFLEHYEHSTFKTGNEMNGPQAYGTPQISHLQVPDDNDQRHYSPSKKAVLNYEGVEYVADNEGDGNAIQLVFDGVLTIDGVVGVWNAANAGNTVSHNAPDDQVQPSEATLSLQGDGVYKLVVDSVEVAKAEASDKVDAIQALKDVASSEKSDQRLATFGTIDKNTSTYLYLSWKRMLENTALWADKGLKAPKQILASDDVTVIFEAGDAIDNDQRVTDYATRMLEIVDDFGVWMALRDQTLQDDIAAL